MYDLESSGAVSQSPRGGMESAYLYIDIDTRPDDLPNEVFCSKGQPTS